MDWVLYGIDRGWDSANYEEAYGEESMISYPSSLRAEDAASFETGWMLGEERYRSGLWQDGTARD